MRDRTDPFAVDARMRLGIRRAVRFYGAGSAMFAYLVGLVYREFDGPTFGEAMWLGGFFLMATPAFLDNWLRLPRPTPRVTAHHIVFDGPRLIGFVGIALGVGMFALMRITETDPDDGPVMELLDRVMPYLSSVFVVVGVLALVRPYRLKVGPTHLRTQELQPTTWVLTAWLNHYLAHPEDRHELASHAGLDRLHEIDAAHRASPDLPWPPWFPRPCPSDRSAKRS